MADRNYSRGRPTQEVRLRNWQGGQVAQFKKAIEMLETELNNAMASQIEQGGKRVVLSRIPKVTGLSVNAGFKNFQISFLPAKGIQDLLFYEIQKDSTSSFSDPTTYTTPQTTLTIPTAAEHELIFVRVRVMNSKFQVGPWSNVDSATGSSNFRINSTRGARVTLTITPTDFNTWIDVATLSIPTTIAAISISAQPGVIAKISQDSSQAPPAILRTNNYYVQFRLLKDGVEDTNAGQSVVLADSSYRNNFGEAEKTEQRLEKANYGVIISPLVTYTQSETIEYIIQAYVKQELSGPNYLFTYSADVIAGTTSQVVDNPIVVIDNFDVLEVIQVT